MKYRILALALALVMVAGLMSACGAPAAESAAAPSTSETGSAAQSAEAPAEEPAAEAPAAEGPAAEASAAEPEPVPEVEYPLTTEDVTFELWYPFPGDLSDIWEEYLGQGKYRVLARA